MRREFDILLFEDNEPDAFLVRTALDLSGLCFRFEVCSDGAEGLGRIQEMGTGEKCCPDLLLLDLNLPRYSGEQILQRMRQTEATSRIPVIVLTSSDSPKERERVSSLGIDHFFRKPPDLDEFMKLGEIVKSLLVRSISSE